MRMIEDESGFCSIAGRAVSVQTNGGGVGPARGRVTEANKEVLSCSKAQCGRADLVLIVELERRVAGLPSTKGGERLQSGGERTGSRNAGRSRVNGATEPMDRNECKG